MDKRIVKLIQILYEKQDYISQDILCEFIGVRPRTLREYLKKYRDIFLDELGIVIVNKNNFGYRLTITDSDKLNQFFEKASSDINLPVEQEDRIKYIISKLLTQNKFIKIDDIADEIFVSKSTISQDLKLIREIFNGYNLEIISKTGVGILINGEEKNIRRCMKDYVFLKKDFLYENIINEAILSSIQEYNFKLSDFGFESLGIHLMIAIYRLKDNISIDECPYNLSDTLEFDIARNIALKIQNKVNLVFNENELGYIAIHLLGNKVFDHRDVNVINFQTLNLVKEILNEIKNKYNIDFFYDVELFSMLASHIEPMLYRLKFDLKLTNPLLEQIKETSAFAYEIGLLCGETITKTAGKEVDENEVGYLALHFNLALKRIIDKDKKRILVVCASGIGTSKFLAYKIKEEYKDIAYKIDILKYYELDNIDETGYDIILSTIPIEKKFNIPVVVINYTLEKNDIKNINKVIYQDDTDLEFIKNCFDKDLFFKDKEFISKEEAIKFMCDKLNESYGLPDDFYGLTIDREGLSSTDIGKYIALPHPTKLVLDYSKIVICHLKKPLFWGKQKVNFIFLLGIEKNFNSTYKLFENVFFNLVNNGEFIRKLINNPSFELFMEELLTTCVKNKTEVTDIFE